jgi:tRNA(Ile)-lysidine synthase
MKHVMKKPFEANSGGFFHAGSIRSSISPRHLPGAVVGICRNQELLCSGDKVLIACSGGLDSSTLVDVLVRSRQALDITLGIAHFNHRLRGEESERDAAFVTTLAEKCGIPCHVGRSRGRRKAGESLQMWARDRRYQYFERIAKREGYTAIATAHTLNDQAETVLMNLLQGYAGRSGGGIQPRRGKIIRPLLSISRRDLAAYAAYRRLEHVEDSSNAGNKYLRNRVRHHLLPLLADDFDSHIVEHLADWGDYVQSVEALVSSQVADAWKQCVKQEDSGQIILEIGAFNRYFTILRKRLIHNALKMVAGADVSIGARQVDEIVACAESARRGRRFQVTDRLVVEVDTDAIVIGLPEDTPYVFDICCGKQHRYLQSRLIFASQWVEKRNSAQGKWQEYLRIHDSEMPLQLRTRKRGDRFQPFGMQADVRLSEYMINRRIPRRLRDTWPLLVQGGNILWVCGVGISEQARVREADARCLAVRYNDRRNSLK